MLPFFIWKSFLSPNFTHHQPRATHHPSSTTLTRGFGLQHRLPQHNPSIVLVSISSIIIIHHPSSIFHLPSTLTIPTRVYFHVAYNQKPSPPTFKNPSIFLSSTRLRAIRVLPDFCPLDPITSIRLPLSIFHLPVSIPAGHPSPMFVWKSTFVPAA